MPSIILKRKTLLIYLILFILPLIFFSGILGGKKVIVAGDLSGSDLLDLHYPFREALHTSLKTGTIPLWLRSISLGFPLFSEGQTGILYFPNLVFSFLPTRYSVDLSILFVFWLTLYSTYYYFRLIGKSEVVALFASIIFSFSSFFVLMLKFVNMVNVASLMPLLLIISTKYFDKRKLRYAIYSGFVVALMFFAGHPQITLYCLMVFFLYSVINTFYLIKRKNILKDLILLIIVTGVVGFGLAAVQILPTLELMRNSTRSANGLYTSDFVFNILHLIRFFRPFMNGNPALGSYKNIHVNGIFWEDTFYIGIIPLLLIIVSTFIKVKRSTKKRNDSYSLFFLVLAVFSFFIMLGLSTYFIFFPATFIPFFAKFRFPQRFGLFLILALVYFAANGFENLLTLLKKHKSVVKIVAIFVITTSTINLYWFANSYVGYTDYPSLIEVPEVVNQMPKTGYFRIYSLTQYQGSNFYYSGWKNQNLKTISSRKLIPPDTNLFYHLDSFTDSGWFEGGLSDSRRNIIENLILSGILSNKQLAIKLLGMYNVKYLLSYIPLKINGLSLIYQEKLPPLGKNLYLYQNEYSLDRIYFVPLTESVDNPDTFFRIVSNNNFNPLQTAVTEGGVSQSKFNGELEHFENENKAVIKSYSNTNVEIEVTTDHEGYLVLTDLYYPGWKVKVNGKDAKMLRTNYIVRSVYLKPGNYKVNFYYQSSPFKEGAIISIITLTISVILLLWDYKVFSKLKPRLKLS